MIENGNFASAKFDHDEKRRANSWISEAWNGGQGRNRTADASLFRAALYRLSYLAISGGLHTCIFGGTG